MIEINVYLISLFYEKRTDKTINYKIIGSDCEWYYMSYKWKLKYSLKVEFLLK